MRFHPINRALSRQERAPRRWRPRLETLEGRALPASPVIPLNNFGNQGVTLKGFEDNAGAGFVSGAGDVNGDGFGDFIVSAAGASAGGIDRGAAYVVFGGPNLGGRNFRLNALGSQGFTLRGYADHGELGLVSNAGDVNGDGFADLIVASPNASGTGVGRGEIYVVFGGASLVGSIITLNALGTGGFTLRGFEDNAHAGESIGAAGDVNGDGFADIIIGARSTDAGGNNRGEAYVVFGSDKLGATTIALNALASGGVTLRGFEDGGLAGGSASSAGDVNADGKTDIITGAGAGGGPDVKVFSGANPATVLADFFAYGAGFTGGVSVAAGDVNGDGRADIITGAGPTGGPHVKVFDGNNVSNVLLSFLAYNSTFTGCVNFAAGDVNGNGRADIITGAGAGGGPHVKVFSNAGALLQSFLAYTPSFSGGVRVTAEDMDGDGRADIITGAGPNGGPHVKAFRGIDRVPLRSFFAFDPGFTGGVFVG